MASFTKIGNTGVWGLRCPLGTEEGETVEVSTRDGRVERKLVGEVVTTDAYGIVARIGYGAVGTPRPAAPAPLAPVVTPPAFAGPTLSEGITLYSHQSEGIRFL